MLKKLLITLALSLALITSINAKTPSQTKQPYPDYFTTKVDKINIAKPNTEITANYPLITAQPKLPAAREFNQLMASTINGIITNFNHEVLKVAINRNTPSTLYIHYRITYFKPNTIVSVQIIVDKFFAGAAHPNEYTYTINYNLAELSALSLDRLFKKNEPYLKIIAEFCKKQLKKKDFGKYATIDQGTKPIPENYLAWSLTPKGLLITFDAYLVAPYVYGKQTVLIPYVNLQRYMLSTYKKMLVA